jgi:hypothetical protein
VISADKTGLQQSFLGGLPGNVAARLARAVELDRLMDGNLPHQDILEGLRPVLRRDPSQRTPTPLRLFCLPFQDLLTSQPRKVKQKASIARSTVMLLWTWLSETLLPEATSAYAEESKALILAQRNSDALARAGQYWLLAADALKTALADDKAARTALGDEAAVADALEIVLLLGASQAVMKIQSMIPVRAPMTDELLWELRGLYDELVQDMADAAPYVAVIAMNRLSRPWEGLRLPLMIARQTGETLIAQTDMGLVGEILFNRLDAMQAQIRAIRHPLFEPEPLLETLRQFGDLSAGVVKEIAVRRDGDWGQRLLKDRAQVGSAMDTFMDRAPKEVANALPMQRGTGKSADFTKAVDAEKRDLALRYVRLVLGSRALAEKASFAAKQKTAYEELCSYLRRYNEDVVAAMRGPANPIVDAQFLLAIEFTTLLFSAEEAQLMRRRGKAAQAAA